MAAQVRDDDFEFTREDVDRLSDALKDKEFRKLLAEYCEEIQDPANQALYQSEITELEKQRGVDVTFINPSPGYVIKTSVAGEKKAFINVCTNEHVEKPSYTIQEVSGKRGVAWRVPHTAAPPHDDHDKKRNRCVVYDVVFHPNTVRMAEKNAHFRKMLNSTACDAVESNHKVSLDRKNLKFPKLSYKGIAIPTVVRKPNPNFKEEEKAAGDSDLLDELYPQRNYPPCPANPPGPVNPPVKKTTIIHKKNVSGKTEAESPYTVPKYVIKQRKDVDMKEFTYENDAKMTAATPSSLVLEVKLPLLSSSAEAVLDVKERHLTLKSERPARYKLEVALPYRVDDEAGSAKFDLSRRTLVVTLPVLSESMPVAWRRREDSGVDTDSNSPCASDEDNSQSHSLVTEIPDSPSDEVFCASEAYRTSASEPKSFLDKNLSYTLPPYTCNVLDNMIAYTLHVKNVDPSSVVSEVLPKNNAIQLKFFSVGAGFFSIHYSLFLKFPSGFTCEKPFTEAWDNNVIVQVQIINTSLPDHYFIGMNAKVLEKIHLEVEGSNIPIASEKEDVEKIAQPVVEVSARGNNEMNISLTLADKDEQEQPVKGSVAIVPKGKSHPEEPGLASSAGSAKGILKTRPPRIGRSHSESSVDFLIHSVFKSSSSCIPEESSSLKKTVRFSSVIARQTFRTNSSILGQKTKNQRKKRNKKRAIERRSSEGDPEGDADEDGSLEALNEDVFAKSIRRGINIDSDKERRDSGLVETDGEHDKEEEETSGPALSKQNNNAFKLPQNYANQGKYQEVDFKNDLIFDLDM